MIEMFEGYFANLNGMDYCIWICGFIMAFIQLLLFTAYYLPAYNKGFEDTFFKGCVDAAPQWLKFFNGTFEIFPLLGLLGTVTGLLNTFGALGISTEGEIEIMGMLKNFAPAMTTTVSGILALLGNLILYYFFTGWIKAHEENKK